MNDFVSLEIFMCQGRRVQRKQIQSNDLVDATLRVVQVTLYCSSQLQQPLCHFKESCPCHFCAEMEPPTWDKKYNSDKAQNFPKSCPNHKLD